MRRQCIKWGLGRLRMRSWVLQHLELSDTFVPFHGQHERGWQMSCPALGSAYLSNDCRPGPVKLGSCL